MTIKTSSFKPVHADAIDRIHDAVMQGASTTRSAINPTKSLPAMSSKSSTTKSANANTSTNDLERDIADSQNAAQAARTNQHDAALHDVKNVEDIMDELEAGEYVKKAELVDLGTFNIVGASKRMNTFRNKTAEQYVFEFQLLDGDLRGSTCLCSFDVNPVRAKYYDAVRKHGGIGPMRLTQIATGGGNEAYVFAKVDGTLISKKAEEQTADNQPEIF